METLNSFIIKISFATQTSEKIRLGRENWRMVLDKRVPVRGRKRMKCPLDLFRLY